MDIIMSDREGKEQKKNSVQVSIDLQNFNLQEFVKGHSGHLRVQRLVFIAEHCRDLKKEAFQLAIDGK
jgi:hypothetical protein